ncbi:GDSL-type esterase/lipase family protein [Aestuariibaculum sediminum]|uniref:Sialate O-acetylesterase n=1 Tax=Aestuariibaculum sediminum TaxID=2770637 RepID=A0A8J6U8I4_9FLAO|nr:GDSL-type esterase/lipase family protein [Aestuariibaculum sediminum]MBD0831602.1 sialate O-acetylesterase [Aestuariibaculum sediminum]
MFSKLAALFILLITGSNYAQKIKVACVGNSVTFGYNIENRETLSYPAQLQTLLGNQYKVGNFGHSGATMLKNGHKPYWNQKAFKNSIAFQPNIVIIHLGLNDQGNNNWPEHKEAFIDDYLELISVYKNLPTKPDVFICRMTPTFSGHHWFEEGMRENFKDVQNKIETIAELAQVELIDLHEPLYRFPEYFPDQLHPTKEGALVIANKVYSAITKNFGGLKVSKLYGENMVFQRHEPIRVSGIANPNDKITVNLNGSKRVSSPGNDGKWQVVFPAMEAGGPYKFEINSKMSKDIDLDSVYIGEVWLASGQSNMDFKVKEMQGVETVLRDSINPNVFVFSMDPKILGSQQFSDEALTLCTSNNYFKYSGWTSNKIIAIKEFSAIAYAFASNLQKALKVPVGILCNAVGGSPTQAWISREQMEQTHETISLLNDTWFNPMVDDWVFKRKAENFGNRELSVRHPYDPTFLFDSGILPILNYNFKGVIWYQGESNTENSELHSRLFKMLVKDWRVHFKKSQLPFYFSQLSSINRPYWGRFRDSQRKLLDLEYTGMAVTLDVGHPTDVHPKRKWIVGERLAKVALAKTYHKNLNFSGPLFDYTNVVNNKLEIHFTYSNGLSTRGGGPVKDIQIAGSDKIFVEAKTQIVNDLLYVWSEDISQPRYVKYGYTSFTEGNLTNITGLPASTFSNE